MSALALAHDLRWSLDAAAFAREAVGFTPDPWQADVLTSASPRLIMNCSRQSGKSSVTSVLACHQALYQPGSTILLISPSLRQSSELFRKVARYFEQIGHAPKKLEDNKLSLELATHSRIVSLPASESTVRGFTADCIIEDEAARVPDDLYRAIRPMLATTGGRLILMSSPFGKRGHFFEEWTDGGGDWQRVCIPATDCPRIAPAFLDEERRKLGDLWFRSEYLCEFADTVSSVFRYEDIAAMVSADVEPLFPALFPDGEDPEVTPLFSESW